MPQPDPYTTLGVPWNATPDDITRAWRKIAQRLHPDRAGGDADAFAEASAAYEILSDPERRKRFDDTGETEQPSRTDHLDLLAQLFDELINQGVARNFLTTAAEIIHGTLTTIARELSKNQKQSTQLDKLRDRVWSTGEFDLYAEVLNSRLDHLKHAHTQLINKRDVFQRAKAALAEYQEKPPEQIQPTTSTHSSLKFSFFQ